MLWVLLKNIAVVGNGFDRRSSPFFLLVLSTEAAAIKENPKYFPPDVFLICHCCGHWEMQEHSAQLLAVP